MTRGLALGALAIAAACSGKPARSAGSPAGHGPIPAATPGAPFAWTLDLTDASGVHHASALDRAAGTVPLGTPRWSCRYAKDRQRDGPSTLETAWLSCDLAGTQQSAATMVMCMTSPARPTDCGAGTLRLSDGSGHLVQLELACHTPGTDCARRPAIDDLQPGGGVPAAGRGTREPVVAAPHFRWQLELGQAATPLGSGRGPVDPGVASWTCTDWISESHHPAYRAVEVGHVTCTSRATADVVETALPCVESAAEPSACQLGSLRVGDGAQTSTLLLECRSPGARCSD